MYLLLNTENEFKEATRKKIQKKMENEKNDKKKTKQKNLPQKLQNFIKERKMS